jgi:acetoin utilization protein AcuA
MRDFRSHKIARFLIADLLSFSRIEQKIIYLVGYSWTWDLIYSKMKKQSYRKMLVDLYSGFEFIEYSTNEPNICLKPENIFMARVGKHVPEKIFEKFKWLRFGLLL